MLLMFRKSPHSHTVYRSLKPGIGVVFSTMFACVSKSLWAPLQVWTTFWTQGAVIIQSLGISWCFVSLWKSGSATPPDIKYISLISRPSHRPVFDRLQYVKWRGKVWSVNDISVYLGRQRGGGVPHRKGRAWCLILLFLSQVLEFQTFMKWKM